MYNYPAIKKNIEAIYEKITNARSTDDGLTVYADFYSKVIKSFENYDHYEKCFQIINSSFEKYLDKFLIFEKSRFKFFNQNKINICFYLPNIANSLAHIEFLHKILKDFNNENYVLYIATNKNLSKNISNHIKDLVNKKIIKEIIQVDLLSIVDIKRFSYEYKNFFDKFIIWALPLIIPVWTKIFSKKVIYVSLKFKYFSFSNLHNGIYFSTKNDNKKLKLKNTYWRGVVTELIDLNFEKHLKDFNKDNIKLITVNRIEKIRNELFLDTVCEILRKIPTAKFFYTGRSEDSYVKNYFKIINLDERVQFIGWVKPNEIINDYDIFLDVPYLSGIIAANFFLSGMPVVTYDETTSSYIDMVKNELYRKFKMKFTFKTKNEYVDYVVKLTSDKKFYDKIKNSQIDSKNLFIKNNINLSDNFFRVIHETNTI